LAFEKTVPALSFEETIEAFTVEKIVFAIEETAYPFEETVPSKENRLSQRPSRRRKIAYPRDRRRNPT
jgi:hypothetical protein